jgi:hypothetical protein
MLLATRRLESQVNRWIHNLNGKSPRKQIVTTCGAL